MGEGTEADVNEPDAPTVPVNQRPNERGPIAVGTGIWAVLLVLGLIFHSTLADHGHTWWIWTALAGTVLGLLGYFVIMRRRPPPPDDPHEPADH